MDRNITLETPQTENTARHGGSEPGTEEFYATDDHSGAASKGDHERTFTMLENNPEVMNDLANRLGVSRELAFYDVYSLDEPSLIAMLPRPVFALLTTIPMTEAWKEHRDAEDVGLQWYEGAGIEEPVVWFRQTIIHGCGLIGLLHCVSNGIPAEMITPGSQLSAFLDKAVPLHLDDRAELLKEAHQLYEASEAAALKGDTPPLKLGLTQKVPHHFVAFVKGRDGHLWELEGNRKGPQDRGDLGEGDAFSPKALQLGIKRLMDIQRSGSQDMRFSCIALAPRTD